MNFFENLRKNACITPFRRYNRLYERQTQTRVRLKEIAETTHLSVSTVSRALADRPEIHVDTRELVQRVSREMGYRPSRRTVGADSADRMDGSGDSPLVRLGYVLIGTTIQDATELGLMQFLSEAAACRGIRTEFCSITDCDDPENVAERTLAYARHVDAVLLTDLVHPQVVRRLQQAKIPCLVVGDLLPTESGLVPLDVRVGKIRSDFIWAGRIATASLLAAGHRRVAFVCGSRPRGLCHDQWLSGYILAHHDRGLRPSDDLIQISGKHHMGTEAEVEVLLALDDPATAFVCPVPYRAAFFMKEMQAHGTAVDAKAVVVGGSVVSVANCGLEHVAHIVADHNAMAGALIDYVTSLIEKPDSPAVDIFVPMLVRHLPEPVPSSR